jgi:hypothetical protein
VVANHEPAAVAVRIANDDIAALARDEPVLQAEEAAEENVYGIAPLDRMLRPTFDEQHASSLDG